MAHLPPIPYTDLEKVVLHVGCTFRRQTASHKAYWRGDQVRPIIIPTYKAVPVFVIKNILRQLGIPAEEFQRILDDL
jgi:predicted RNA binding protein YcfA (HicA-like mRNA interferase family)